MHERSPKNDELATILYEIDMLRHCAQTLGGKHANAKKSGSETAMAEYYLGIEGFLLHLRNMLAFLTGRKGRGEQNTDLIINEPEHWAGRVVERHEYSDLIKRAKELDRAHGDGSTCYDQISKFLQHCTTFRHERAKSWAVEKIFADLDPMLRAFEERFGRMAPRVPMLGDADNSTASFRIGSRRGK